MEPAEPIVGYELAADIIGSMLLDCEVDLTKCVPESGKYYRIYHRILALNLALDCIESARKRIIEGTES